MTSHCDVPALTATVVAPTLGGVASGSGPARGMHALDGAPEHLGGAVPAGSGRAAHSGDEHLAAAVEEERDAEDHDGRAPTTGRGALVSGVLALLAAGVLVTGVVVDPAPAPPPGERPRVVAPEPVEVDTAALDAPALGEPDWLPEGVDWRGPARYPGASGVRAYVLRTPGPDPRSSTLLLQTATSDDRLPPPYGASTVVAVAGRPASLVRTFAGGRELRWSDSRGSFRLQAGAGSGGPADATLVAVAAGVSDPRRTPGVEGPAPLPRALPAGARRLPEVETQVAGYQPSGSAVRAWEVDGTRLLYRVEPGEEPLRSRRFDVSSRTFDVAGTTAVLAVGRLADRPRDVRWNAGGRAFHLTVSAPAPAPGEPGVTDAQLEEVVRSVA